MELDEKTIQGLKDNKIQFEDLANQYFIDDIFNDDLDFSYKLEPSNIENILKLLNNKICSFRQIIDKYKNMQDAYDHPCLWCLLNDEKLFEELVKSNKLCFKDLEYLLNRIDGRSELDAVCRNALLIKQILNEFVFNKKIVDKLNELVENSWYRNYDVHTVFDQLEYFNELFNDKNIEILKLSKLNNYVMQFKDNERANLRKILKNNEIAQNRLSNIIENQIKFDYSKLIQHLTKVEKKSLMNI